MPLKAINLTDASKKNNKKKLIYKFELVGSTLKKKHFFPQLIFAFVFIISKEKLVWFYGRSTIESYSMPNSFYTYQICLDIFCRKHF